MTICARLKETYPKFQEIKGGWLLYKSSGGWGSRKLTLIPPDESRYNAKNLKTATNGFKGVLYIAPLQIELDTTALPPESESFNEMPKEKCQRCGVSYPLLILTTHINTCVNSEDAEQTNDDADQTSDEAEQTKQATCPICQKEMSLDVIEIHASFCMGDSIQPLELNVSMEEPSTSGVYVPLTYTAEPSNAAKATSMSHDWKIEPDKNKAASLYTKEIIRQHETGKSLLMTMDVRMDKEDQDRELVAFYKQNGMEWACPVKCKLQGDAAIGEGVTRHFFSTVIQRLQHGFNFNMGNTARTCLFEGEPGHLVPSSSQFLIESDLFLVAGRMIGPAFLHGGPRLAGVSQAIVHVLLGGSAETATVQIEDCPDHDIRETIKLLDGEAELSSEEYQPVLDLSLAWDLPGPTKENRKWLFERLLPHAVIGRRLRQLKQIRKGLKETRVWPLLSERKDVEIFLRENENSLTPSMLLNVSAGPRISV
uniref:HECT domain-containing protein n=1 Tax=Cyprinus carpio carpio TaxID=630221 RepID=A0A9J8CC04_CYPCA